VVNPVDYDLLLAQKVLRSKPLGRPCFITFPPFTAQQLYFSDSLIGGACDPDLSRWSDLRVTWKNGVVY
jgi:hypothetical protein